ncbi:hypothetical protein QF001_004574 [Paraburkholderia youngii]|uniref:hypothetical protein n=1 Tax=Paraburkholderia youngii TaxID=2782701 RepID=UPI003D25DE8F
MRQRAAKANRSGDVALRTKAESIRTLSGQVTRAGDAVYRPLIAVPELQNTETMTLASVMKAIPPEHVI